MELKNFRHELYARALIAHKGNQTLAYIEVYKNCSRQSARSKASRLVAFGNIKHRVAELLLENRPLIESMTQVLSQALNAKRLIKTKEGVIEEPDHRTRFQAFVTGLKLLGYLK